MPEKLALSRKYIFRPLFIALAAGLFSGCHSMPSESRLAGETIPAESALKMPLPLPTVTSTATGTRVSPKWPSPPEPSAGYTRFGFRSQLLGTPSTLSLFIQNLDPKSGQVEINGVDTRQPKTPFTWNWGDGTTSHSYFPAKHCYTDRSRNYVIQVTIQYSDGNTDTQEKAILFSPISIKSPVAFPSALAVTIPSKDVSLTSRLYELPSGITVFDDSFFGNTPRAVLEYILSVAAWVQDDITNSDETLFSGGFPQVVYRWPQGGGMSSLWFTDPVGFISGDYGFRGELQYSSFFHEMGHNFSLNSPVGFPFGGKIDGDANAILSESLANIYAHATAYEILNHPDDFGVDEFLALQIRESAIASMGVTRRGYEDYLAAGKPFHTWNDPATTVDETFGTFMTVAYLFCRHAEESGLGYRLPAKRMMALLQRFDTNLLRQYDPENDTPDADSFRSTWMIAALSYAFSSDLRPEFRDLNFPVDDGVYQDLLERMNS